MSDSNELINSAFLHLLFLRLWCFDKESQQTEKAGRYGEKEGLLNGNTAKKNKL